MFGLDHSDERRATRTREANRNAATTQRHGWRKRNSYDIVLGSRPTIAVFSRGVGRYFWG